MMGVGGGFGSRLVLWLSKSPTAAPWAFKGASIAPLSRFGGFCPSTIAMEELKFGNKGAYT
jgi:hypothetical protein